MKNSNPVKRFTVLGRVGNEPERRELCRQTYELLVSGEGEVSALAEERPELIRALNSVLADERISGVCKGRNDLSEHITEELIRFVSESCAVSEKGDPSLDEELERLQEFKAKGAHKFEAELKSLSTMLSDRYTDQEIDQDFYTSQLNAINEIREKEDRLPALEKLKSHLEQTWEAHLASHLLAHKLQQIDQLRQKYLEELYKGIDELQRLEDLLSAVTGNLGRLWDLSKGHLSRMNFEHLQRYAHLLERDKSIQELAEVLGRMQQAQKKIEQEQMQESHIVHRWQIDTASKSDLVGVRESDDINALLPTEVALLADPSLELSFYKKYAEKKLQTFEYQSRVLKAEEERRQVSRQKTVEEPKGPFIICIDTSGSMHGVPEAIAKALCIAILKVALRDERRCFLISFSTQIDTIELSNTAASLTRLLDFLGMSFYGGTDASPALATALAQLEKESYSRADVIMVSDFVMPQFPEKITRDIAKAKERGTKFHSLVVGQGYNQVDLNAFDSNWFYDSHSAGSTLRLVQELDKLH